MPPKARQPPLYLQDYHHYAAGKVTPRRSLILSSSSGKVNSITKFISNECFHKKNIKLSLQ